jgi:hypothetical protein
LGNLVLATETASGRGGLAACAAAGVAAAARNRNGVLLVEVDSARARGPTMLASEAARSLERSLRMAGIDAAAARGRLCWLSLPTEGSVDRLSEACEVATAEGADVVVFLPPPRFRDALELKVLHPGAVVLRADLSVERSLCAVACRDLQARGLRIRIAKEAPGPIAARRTLAGLDAGGTAARQAARLARGVGLLDAAPFGTVSPSPGSSARGEAGQALPLALGAALVTLVVALALVAIGGAVSGAGRAQRMADLAALSAARSMRDDLPRLLAPARLAGGAPNPSHLGRASYLTRAVAAAGEAAEHNGADAGRLRVAFPDRASMPPVRVRVQVRAEVGSAQAGNGDFVATAQAEAAVPASYDPMPGVAAGGGYVGPLAYRQGKPMRPDVAAGFDRLAAAAAKAGLGLVINSAYRSDAEQARLFAQNPDPRWVAPPGHSLHRCATELDLGPPAAYPWLHANAPRFGFVARYSWEPWHFGWVRGPAPCSGSDNTLGGRGDGHAGGQALPGFVPVQFRDPLLAAASRWGVSAGLLAAQLEAESGFDPKAVSPAGAQGIVQFMPGTAAAYGLRDPFDPLAAIDAQAHLMSDLLRRFGSPSLALAAYNAGAGPVEACSCVPPYPETQAYVARILALMGSAGEVAAPPLEVRLVD